MRRVRMALRVVCAWTMILPFAALAQGHANEISWALKYDPRTLDPALVDDQASNTLRYLTGGVLLRVNRLTMQVEPALAERWEMSPDGRLLSFHLRAGLRFSDGSALRSEDVVASLRRVFDPATAAPVLEAFAGVAVSVDSPDAATVRVHLARRVAGLTRIFDEIAIEPAGSTNHGRVTAGPFAIAEYKRGESLHLVRNNCYWRRDAAGKPMPYLNGVRLEIISNPEQNELRFERGRYQLLESVAAEDFATLSRRSPAATGKWAHRSTRSNSGSTSSLRLPFRRGRRAGSRAAASAARCPGRSIARTWRASRTTGTPRPPTASSRRAIASGVMQSCRQSNRTFKAHWTRWAEKAFAR